MTYFRKFHDITEWEKPHTSSGHMITNTIKAHSNCVLLTSNPFQHQREHTIVSLHLDSPIEDNRNSSMMPNRQNNPVTDLPDLPDSL